VNQAVPASHVRSQVTLMLIGLVIGCVSPLPRTPEQRQVHQVISGAFVGTPFAEVKALLGEPEQRESYRRSPDRNVTFLFYRTEPSSGPERGYGSGLQPLAIEYGRVERISWSYYNSIKTRFPLIKPWRSADADQDG